MGNVISNQERFDGVHIGVAATVVFGFAKGFVRVSGTSALLHSEVFLNHFYG